ncbi:AAA family ATPase [Photobacterium sanguinicancri]|uniref:AAA family ATPase n=1 Tax=Photobacterium sanguinicancri TaxID=875932 RepID=UPI0024803965|nr:AAA family ATPase [Photobacterium sanguinicancri]
MDFGSFVTKLEQFGFRNDGINKDFEYRYENNNEIGKVFYQSVTPLFEGLSERNDISFSTGSSGDKYNLKFYLDRASEDAGSGTFIFSLNLQVNSGYLSFSQTENLLLAFSFQAVLSDGNHPIVTPRNNIRRRVDFLEQKKALGLAIIPTQDISQYWQACLLELGISFSDTSPQFWQRCDQISQPAEQAFLFGIARQLSQILRHYNAQAYSNQDNQLLYQTGNAIIGGMKFGANGLSFEFNLSQANIKQISFYPNIKSVLNEYNLPFTQEGNWLKVIIDSRTFTKATTLVNQWYQTITPVSPSQQEGDEMKIFNQNGTAMTHSPLNQILFGPPGTGKTFETTEAAVKAADPAFYCQLNIDPAAGATTEQHQALTIRYKALSEAGRIRFVTFHQSYGYEEFVEGLRAETTEDNQISYKVSDGIFKSISNAASVSELHLDADINHNGRVWKLSIEGTQRNAAKSHCLEANIAAIGWGKTGDLSQEPRNEYFLSQGTNNQNSLNYFSQEMEEGDLVLCIDSKTSVEAIGVVSGPYRYVEDGVPSRHDYCHQLPIKWLAKDFSVDFKELNNNTQFSLPTCYPLSRLSVAEVLNHLHSHGIELSDSAPSPAQSHVEQHNHVLVIDEINRGNISKIFGELITLIEESKRAGNNEEITLTLPYSGKTFAVPNNLYIIGTMNTADRSLVTMDTALRRRFDFKEMMPKPELFNNRTVKGIDLTRLLATLNKRIDVLYDREHTLGHAFLFPVFNEANEDNAFIKLKDAFKNKIIPLLEEYFYEDWNKIRLVLGDNQKELADGRDYAFIHTHTDSYDALFGNNHGLETYEDSKVTYKLKAFDDAVWDQPEAYITIYSKSE